MRLDFGPGDVRMIKEVRERTGVGLREATIAVQAFAGMDGQTDRAVLLLWLVLPAVYVHEWLQARAQRDAWYAEHAPRQGNVRYSRAFCAVSNGYRSMNTGWAIKFARGDWTLRTGGADGADHAFLVGALAARGFVELYLPWPGFNGWSGVGAGLERPTPAAYECAVHFHPNWAACDDRARALHARNSHQILGRDVLNPVLPDFVMCWTPGGFRGGGTGQAPRIAVAYHVPVIDWGVGRRALAVLHELTNDGLDRGVPAINPPPARDTARADCVLGHCMAGDLCMRGQCAQALANGDVPPSWPQAAEDIPF